MNIYIILLYYLIVFISKMCVYWNRINHIMSWVMNVFNEVYHSCQLEWVHHWTSKCEEWDSWAFLWMKRRAIIQFHLWPWWKLHISTPDSVVVMRPLRSLKWLGQANPGKNASSKCGRHRWPCNFGCIHDPWIDGYRWTSDHQATSDIAQTDINGQGMTGWVCTGPPWTAPMQHQSRSIKRIKCLRACWGQADRVS